MIANGVKVTLTLDKRLDDIHIQEKLTKWRSFVSQYLGLDSCRCDVEYPLDKAAQAIGLKLRWEVILDTYLLSTCFLLHISLQYYPLGMDNIDYQ